jgi:hypothetical protein
MLSLIDEYDGVLEAATVVTMRVRRGVIACVAAVSVTVTKCDHHEHDVIHEYHHINS